MAVTTEPSLARWAPWWALLVVPSVFLGCMSAGYALAPLACRRHLDALLHVAPLVALVVALVGLALSAWTLHRLRREAATPAVDARRFLGGIGVALGLLFLVAAALQWYVAAGLSPCVQ